MEETLESSNYCLEGIDIILEGGALHLITPKTRFLQELNRRGKHKFLYNTQGDEASLLENWIHSLSKCEDVQSYYYFLCKNPIVCNLLATNIEKASGTLSMSFDTYVLVGIGLT